MLFRRAPALGFVGHNPLGGMGVVVMLVLLLTQAGTGLFANDEISNTGPLFGWVSGALSDQLSSIHHGLFNALLSLIVLHITSVMFYALYKRASLIRPMFTGRKSLQYVPAEQEIHSSRPPLAIALLALLLLLYLVSRAPAASLSPF
jgi:cytochrome b